MIFKASFPSVLEDRKGASAYKTSQTIIKQNTTHLDPEVEVHPIEEIVVGLEVEDDRNCVFLSPAGPQLLAEVFERVNGGLSHREHPVAHPADQELHDGAVVDEVGAQFAFEDQKCF